MKTDEYITRGDAIELIERYGGDIAVREIKRLPAADVRQVVHGYWKPLYDTDADRKRGMAMRYECSECGRVSNDETYSHLFDYELCPYCGAKMDEEGQKSEMNDWIEVKAQTPPENQIVETKIDDEKGIRNETELIYYKGLWWFPDMSMYMYYTPTHWRYMDGKDGEQE